MTTHRDEIRASRLAIITRRTPLAPIVHGEGEGEAFGRLRLGDAPPGAPKCDRCNEPANVELTCGPRSPQTYCVPCLAELVGFGLDLVFGVS